MVGQEARVARAVAVEVIERADEAETLRAAGAVTDRNGEVARRAFD